MIAAHHSALVLLAERFPQPDVPARVRCIAAPTEESVLSLPVPGTVEVQQSSSELEPRPQRGESDAEVVATDDGACRKANAAAVLP